MEKLTAAPAWRALHAHWGSLAGRQLRELFAADPRRAQRFSLSAAGLHLDYSKNLIVQQSLDLLLQLAHERALPRWVAAMFAGEKINNTEQRAALHVALRNRSARPITVDGVDVMPEVRRVQKQITQFSEAVRSGQWRGYSGRPIRAVVNLGIGGSDLGPAMVCAALKHYASPALGVQFVSNVDGTQLSETLQPLDPATTLFIVASKTFSTEETLANAHSARHWLLRAAGDERAVARHFVAVSTNRKLVTEFGIAPENMFEFWDWVGGRYSLWSAIGLSIALAIGAPNFERLLDGAHAMDEHFRSAPLAQNMPVILALLGIWYRNFFGAASYAILPYAQSLARLPAHLQQLEMESNGKRVDRAGQAVDYATAPIIWGEPGTNGQHAFFQLIHQGTELVPADFILARTPPYALGNHHAMLYANCLAQSEALMTGKNEQEVDADMQRSGIEASERARLLPHRVFPGNKPSNTLLLPALDPASIGALIALYEHKVYAQGVIWNINSFDQWGVELGKQLAKRILGELGGAAVGAHDASTAALLEAFRS